MIYPVIDRATSSPALALVVALTVTFVLYTIVDTVFLRQVHTNAPPVIRDNYPLSGAIGFWTERWGWFQRKMKQSKTGNFTFNAGSHTIVALSGDKGRQLFFDSAALNFREGYAVLFGAIPPIDAHDDGKGKEDDVNNQFNRRLIHLLKNEHLHRKLRTIISDTQEGIEAIKNDPSGITNPFESIYRIVFRLTIRMVGANEIAEDAKMLEETLRLFEMIDSSATAAAVMFPRIPSPGVIKRTYAGARLYMMVEKLIKKRAASDEKHDDALQYMLDKGDRTFKIVEFIIGSLFAGLLNSGINAAWVLCYLATSPEWLAKVQHEVRTTAAKYARDPSAPLRHQLDDVPLEAWESDFPIIDICLRDSIRLNLLGTALRKNVSGKAIPTGHGNEVIPPGAFVTYAVGDTHLDPAVYTNPHTWDPARYLPERAEDKKKDTYGFLGWGVGRHPCLGMRFAKLEQNIITAYFIASFDFSLQDKTGKTLAMPPKVDFNRHSAHKPATPQFLKVTPKEK